MVAAKSTTMAEKVSLDVANGSDDGQHSHKSHQAGVEHDPSLLIWSLLRGSQKLGLLRAIGSRPEDRSPTTGSLLSRSEGPYQGLALPRRR
jgi:hypothetical protein